ncbi:MAG: MipA/OmpV family protein [Bdellovibrionales bacterium]|nr:MipA/OmpV family protein [Bdellovibrionales bacterium]
MLYRKLPKWEAGLFSGYFYLPDYPGAEESQSRFLILPYVIYRGEIIRSDRGGGLRGRFFNSDVLDFDVSVGAGFKTHSADNQAREGMPDLDWMGEIGPRALIHLHKGSMIKIDLSLPIRYVFTTNFKSIDSQGYLFQPELKFRHRALFDDKLFFSFGGGPVWGSESLNDYFYEVSPAFAKADRPAYDASSGYMGLQTYIAVVRRMTQDVNIFLGLSKNYYKNAENIESPLFRSIETESYFLGLSWGLYTSGVGSVDLNED